MVAPALCTAVSLPGGIEDAGTPPVPGVECVTTVSHWQLTESVVASDGEVRGAAMKARRENVGAAGTALQ